MACPALNFLFSVERVRIDVLHHLEHLSSGELLIDLIAGVILRVVAERALYTKTRANREHRLDQVVLRGKNFQILGSCHRTAAAAWPTPTTPWRSTAPRRLCDCE